MASVCARECVCVCVRVCWGEGDHRIIGRNSASGSVKRTCPLVPHILRLVSWNVLGTWGPGIETIPLYNPAHLRVDRDQSHLSLDPSSFVGSL